MKATETVITDQEGELETVPHLGGCWVPAPLEIKECAPKDRVADDVFLWIM